LLLAGDTFEVRLRRACESNRLDVHQDAIRPRLDWNDYLWPLLITSSADMRTLPAGLALFMGQHVIEYSVM
jgi:hypothetical protein